MSVIKKKLRSRRVGPPRQAPAAKQAAAGKKLGKKKAAQRGRKR